MSLTFYSGSYIGVNKIVLPEDDGVLIPALQQAQAIEHDRVRFTFSRDMRFDPPMGGDLIKLLDPAYYSIKEEATLVPLNISRVYKKNDYEVEAICENMSNVQYIAEVSPDLEDIHGTKIGDENTKLFTGLSLLYPLIQDLYGFFGLYAGIQLVTITGVTPDTQGPEVSNKIPDSGQLVHPVYRLSFDLTDRNGVNEDSVVIRVNDQVAWQNDMQQTGFTGKKTIIEDGFHYDIDAHEAYPHESIIPVRIQASDLWHEPNTSDTQWTFNTGSRGPYAVYQFPLPDAEEATSSHIVIELKSKFELRKETIKIWVQPSEDEPYEFAFDYSAYPKFKEKYNGANSSINPIDNGLKIILDRIEDYDVGKVVSVIVHSAEKA